MWRYQRIRVMENPTVPLISGNRASRMRIENQVYLSTTAAKEGIAIDSSHAAMLQEQFEELPIIDMARHALSVAVREQPPIRAQ